MAVSVLAAGGISPTAPAGRRAPAAEPTSPPQRAGYCLPDGTYVDLVVGQPDTDPRWAEARPAPNGGAGPCEPRSSPAPPPRGSAGAVPPPHPPRDRAAGVAGVVPAAPSRAGPAVRSPAARAEPRHATPVARWTGIAVAGLAAFFLVLAGLSSPRLVRARLPGLVGHGLELAAVSASLLLSLAAALAL